MAILIKLIFLLTLTFASIPNLDHEDELFIGTNSTLTVQISSNPTTGYLWKALKPVSDKISVPNPSGVYKPAASGSPMGTSGKQFFEIVCNEKCIEGSVEYLTFVKKREWEQVNVETRNVKVNVSNLPRPG